MSHITYTTKSIKASNIIREWHLIDVSKKPLGRVIPDIAYFLQGKNKKNYAPYLDMGDNVVVINASKTFLTGDKKETKRYYQYSGYPGGLRLIPFEKMQAKHPSEIIRRAVAGMLPKNKLRDKRLSRLHIFSEEKHTFVHKFKNL